VTRRANSGGMPGAALIHRYRWERVRILPTPELTGRMALSEKIVREAFKKKKLSPLEAHLRAIELGDEAVTALVQLLERGCLPLFEYPNADGERQRADWVEALAAVIEEKRDRQAADAVRDVLAQLRLIESGYRTIIGHLRGLDASRLAPELRVSAILDLTADRREQIRVASADAIVIDGVIDPLGLGIDDGHGHSVSPDVPIDVDVTTTTMALKMEAHQRGWFDDNGQFVLPDRRPSRAEDRAAVHELLIAAQAWRHWAWMEEETRYFGGTLTDVDAQTFPEEYREKGVRRLLHHVPGAAGWHALDLAANERLLVGMKQQSARMLFETNISEASSGISGRVELFPKAFVSTEEVHSAQALDKALSSSIATDTSLYRGLRLVEWIRGYAVLQQIVSDAYDASNYDPARLNIEMERAELVALLQRLGLAGPKAETFISLATFDRISRDLFDTPLIRVGVKTILIFGAGLLGAIPAQTTLSRLATLKQSLEGRGKAFERAMLAFMKDQGLDAQAKKVKRGREEYDYDLLVRWEERIFLFECKSRSLSGNNLIASYYDSLEIGSQVKQVRRLVEGLARHPDILEEVFGPGANELELVPCVLNVLPMSLPTPIEGIYFIDAAALTRLFHSPAFTASVGGSADADSKCVMADVQTHRLWAGPAICSDDLMRQLQSPVQLELMLRQISTDHSGGWLGDGTLATTTRIFHQPASTTRLVEMLADRPDVDGDNAEPAVSDG
jgi:hypothetical protein